MPWVFSRGFFCALMCLNVPECPCLSLFEPFCSCTGNRLKIKL